VTSLPPDLDLRRAPLEDPERFAPLMRAAFGLRVSERHFTWKFVENPSGPAVGFEAIGPDGPAALYCVIPETYLVRGQRTRVHQTVDIMIHPDYRGSGLYMALAHRMYEHLLAEQGGYTLLAFPNPKLLSVATKRTGWTLLHTIPFVFLPRIVHRARRWRSEAKDVTFTTVQRATELEPYLSVRDHSSRAVSVELSPEFLQWRAFDHPYSPAQACLAWRGAEPVGMCLFSTDAKSRCLIQLSDFITPQMCDRAFVALAAFLFEQTGASVLYTWEPTDDARRAVLRRSGFVKNPVGKGPGSARYSLVARSEPRLVQGQDWLDPANIDAQPIMHD
jgi:GNAT superfamily N-acetyltransferase